MTYSSFPIYFPDPPEIINTPVTPIPANTSPPLQIVANTGPKAALRISWIDTTGDYVGVYTGTPGNEVLRCIIGGGLVSVIPVVIAAFNRVSIRSMTASPITQGTLMITFLGQG